MQYKEQSKNFPFCKRFRRDIPNGNLRSNMVDAKYLGVWRSMFDV